MFETRNQEGYKDSTAYTALSSVAEEAINVGDIWSTKDKEGSPRTVLVIAKGPGYAVTYMLFPDNRRPTNIEILTEEGNRFFLDPGKPSFTIINRFKEFYERADGYAIPRVKRALADVLGLRDVLAEDVASEATGSSVASEATPTPGEAARLQEALRAANEVLALTQHELELAKAKVETYKELYKETVRISR